MGKVIMSGIVPTLKAPVTGILASSLAVGSTVKLMEGGAAVEYLVVNQGIPSNSNLYDASCDGTWLLRKDCHSKKQWFSTANRNDYVSSIVNTWLNGDFFNSLGGIEQAAAKQVKIPYGAGFNSSTVNIGTDGLPCKIFLLAGYEVGFTTSDNSGFPVDGAKLDYFISGSSGNSRRIAKFSGSAIDWWLRSPYTSSSNYAWNIVPSGGNDANGVTNSFGARPALILPSNALFDESTMLLKGVT